MISDYKSIDRLCKENNNTFELNKFMNQYREQNHQYYIHEGSCFYKIKDKEMIEAIKRTKSEYSDENLDSNKDISKMYQSIKKTIISQDEQVMKILTSLFKNHQVVNSKLSKDVITKLKENILIYGPTGTGKTEILKRIADIYGVPIVIEDATSLSETGYVGRNVTDMLKDLYLASSKNINSAETGILVIDEFDKLAEHDKKNTHVSRNGVQRALLKLLDGSDFYIDNIKFNTSKLTIVALGAFSGITEDHNYDKITLQNFIEYGIMRELMGRFSKLIAMNSFTKEDIKKILRESNFSPINIYQQLFDMMKIEFTYDEDFLEYVATRAIELGSGARSLKTIFDEIISGAMFNIFAGEYSSIQLTKPGEDKKVYVLSKKE